MKKYIPALMVMLLSLMGCSFTLSTGPTGDTASQTTSAQSFLPEIAGYTRTNADSIGDAITSVGGGASLISGNPALAAAIAKIDDMIQCYQNTGSVAANIYTESNLSSVLQGQIPSIGALAVVNEDRLSRNFLNCALSGSSAFSAQGVSIEPCFGSGTFTKGNEKLDYVYAATAPGLCQSFQSYFDSIS
ncbi:MAG: hypothetical protein K8J31_28740 [Anaerolineae bacterium]|nr:hypothetical protein [Anaerolineae bacterium]